MSAKDQIFLDGFEFGYMFCICPNFIEHHRKVTEAKKISNNNFEKIIFCRKSIYAERILIEEFLCFQKSKGFYMHLNLETCV